MDSIGRYRIVKEIGRGAMGIVYLATDPTIGRSVAIKTVRLREIDNAQQRDKLRERLFREARSAGVLSHPNIVTIYDMAEEDGVAYIAMEFVDGPTLDEILSSGKPLESSKLFGILRQTATALDYAHSKGIVHRDIKPANIMLGRDGNVKVTDFGIAKINTAADSFTMTGTLVGTPNYMSPEQVQGNEVTGRSDQFSLAVITYEILTGERPFPGEQLSTVVYKIVAEEPVSPQKLNGTLGPQIDGVLRKALSKKPPNRYRTCAEFIGSLETTCASTKGWMPMTRGASLNMSTMGGAVPAMAAPRIPNPPAGKVRPQKEPLQSSAASSAMGANDSSRDPRRQARRESRVLPLAAAILMVTGIFSLLTWQGNERSSANPPEAKQTEPAPVPTPAPEPKSEVKAETKPVDTPPAAEPDTKAATEPESKPETKAETKPADRRGPQGAEAVTDEASRARGGEEDGAGLPSDGSREQVAGSYGDDESNRGYRDRGWQRQQLRHALHHAGDAGTAFVFGPPGRVSGGAARDSCGKRSRGGSTDLPAQERGTAHDHYGSAGATITINNKVQSKTTPAQINLSPGSYTVMVEKDGKRQVDRVEIREGNTNYVKIPLE